MSISYIPVCNLTKECPRVEHFTLYDKEGVGALSSALQEEHLYACRRLSEVIIISHFSRVDHEVTVQTCRHSASYITMACGYFARTLTSDSKACCSGRHSLHFTSVKM